VRLDGGGNARSYLRGWVDQSYQAQAVGREAFDSLAAPCMAWQSTARLLGALHLAPK
jgi:hypothetical protein